MSQSFEQGAEMSKDVNELIMSWQSQGYDPVVCTYSILLRFTAIAAGMIEEEDLGKFLDDARKKGLELHEQQTEGNNYAH